jgi:hypothetical protein
LDSEWIIIIIEKFEFLMLWRAGVVKGPLLQGIGGDRYYKLLFL